MKKAIVRNIAIISVIFIVTFSIMLITNYFQVRGTTPLQTEVIETLKEINDQNAGNTVLQEQIRQLDLLARNAYFVRMDHLTSGVYILIGMLIVFVVCIRVYFAREKNIPDKEIDPIDEWAIKTKARKYIIWGASSLAVIALVFVAMTSPYLRSMVAVEESAPALVAEVDTENISETESASEEAITPETTGEESTEVSTEPATQQVAETTAVIEAPKRLLLPKRLLPKHLRSQPFLK